MKLKKKNKIETREEIEIRVKLGKNMLDNFRGKIISRKQAKKILELTNKRFKVAQLLLENQKRVMVAMQESIHYNEYNACKEKYEHIKELGEVMLFMVKTRKLIDF